VIARCPQDKAQNPMTDHLQNAIAAGRYVMIAGPTAAGKSALAMTLAARIDGVIINADSMQLYRDLRILTARPDEQDEAQIPHRLYGVLDAAERASVARWLDLVAVEATAARKADRMPIIIGGTGMYLQAAWDGIAAIPAVPDDIHTACITELAQTGGSAFRAALGRHDPVTADRLFDGDSQRLVRAMGVVRATGRPISAWQQDPHQGAVDGTALKIAVVPPREQVYQAINARFAGMMESGAIAEVEALAARKLDPGLPVMKAIGVREIIAMQQGKLDRADAIERASRDSRHYAKRQLTWLRNNYNADYSIDSQLSERNIEEIFSYLSLST
jgi:tRNA dimethylallyltransferase